MAFTKTKTICDADETATRTHVTRKATDRSEFTEARNKARTFRRICETPSWFLTKIRFVGYSAQQVPLLQILQKPYYIRNHCKALDAFDFCPERLLRSCTVRGEPAHRV